MKDGDFMYLKINLHFALLFISFNAFAIDNPEKFHLYENFTNETATLTSRITAETDDYKAVKMYADYNNFLEKELNSTYTQLLKKLDASNSKKLINSQKKWLIFRASEIEFIKLNWNIENFGTSSRLSKLAHISNITKSRIETLLSYSIEY